MKPLDREAVAAWRGMDKLLPGWRPTLGALNALDDVPLPVLRLTRALSRDWHRDDARWDVLVALLEYTRRQHAHVLAERIRNSSELRGWTDDHMSDCNKAADLIDSEVKFGD